MKILYVSSEAAPFVKTGGLGDVAGSLPKALAAKGHEVAVILPLYSCISKDWRSQMTFVKSSYVQLAWRNQYCGVFCMEVDKVKFYFIDNEYYFSRMQVYGEYDDAERFAFFSKSVLEVLPDIGFQPEIIHCNDWQTALVPIYYTLSFKNRAWYEGMKTIFTIHNIAYQGQYGHEILEYVLGIDNINYKNGFMRHNNDVNLMKAAIECCDKVTTVSPTYAEEIKTAYYGHSLDSVLRFHEGKLCGIINGLDTDLYNPETDTHLFCNYGPATVQKKEENRQGLLKLCGLEAGDDTPVIGMISRFVGHKGFDLVESVLNDILEQNLRLIVLGKGDWRYEQMFLDAKRQFPAKISVNIMFSGDLADKIYAGSDIFLMPSQSEPCGLAQMIAMRYGTIPLVRETGGLKDTVTPYFEGTGSGFTFANYSAGDMLSVIQQACGLYRHDKKNWTEMMRRDMLTDFSWNNSAEKYLDVYQSLL